MIRSATYSLSHSLTRRVARVLPVAQVRRLEDGQATAADMRDAARVLRDRGEGDDADFILGMFDEAEADVVKVADRLTDRPLTADAAAYGIGAGLAARLSGRLPSDQLQRLTDWQASAEDMQAASAALEQAGGAR